MDLYIIGNGFDIAHGLKTSFDSFNIYLEENKSNVLFLFDGKDYWSDFEYNICAVDSEAYKFIFKEFHDIHGYVNSMYDEIASELRDFLLTFNYKCNKKFRFNTEDIFLNFNYTPTLIDTYGIKKDNIYYIHGELNDPDSELILGHDGNEFAYNPNLFELRYEEDYMQFTWYTRKPYDTIMDSDRFASFIERAKECDKIVVFGLSYGIVDLHYLYRIVESLSMEKQYVFYYYSEDDLDRLNEFLKDLNKAIKYKVLCSKGDGCNEKEL